MPLVPQVAIDLGTETTRITRAGDEQILQFPSRVVKDSYGNFTPAKSYSENKNHILPVVHGKLQDMKAGRALLSNTLESVLPWWGVFRPRVIFAAHADLTRGDQKQIGKLLESIGARHTYMTSMATLAAMGAGIQPSRVNGRCIVSIGAGRCEAAVIASGGVVESVSVKIGGNDLNAEICDFVNERYDSLIDPKKAARILKKVDVSPNAKAKEHHFRFDKKTAKKPHDITLSNQKITERLKPLLEKMTAAVNEVLKNTPVKLLGDVTREDVLLVGGVANMSGISEFMTEEIGLPCAVVESPKEAVIRGGRKSLAFIKNYKQFVPQ